MNEQKKYEFTGEIKVVFGINFKQIRAIINFGCVVAGEIGGWIEKEENLSQSGDAWVYGDAKVSGNAKVFGDAKVYGNADYTIIQGFGSEYRNTTFFKCKDGNIGVKCGCFYGTLDEFRSKVKETHKDSKFAKEYLMIADLMEYHFNSERKETDEEQNRQSQEVH